MNQRALEGITGREHEFKQDAIGVYAVRRLYKRFNGQNEQYESR